MFWLKSDLMTSFYSTFTFFVQKVLRSVKNDMISVKYLFIQMELYNTFPTRAQPLPCNYPLDRYQIVSCRKTSSLIYLPPLPTRMILSQPLYTKMFNTFHQLLLVTTLPSQFIFSNFGDPFELFVMDSKNGGSQQIVL